MARNHASTLLMLCLLSAGGMANAQTPVPLQTEIQWDKTIRVSRSTPTLQVVTNPMLNPGARDAAVSISVAPRGMVAMRWRAALKSAGLS